MEVRQGMYRERGEREERDERSWRKREQDMCRNWRRGRIGTEPVGKAAKGREVSMTKRNAQIFYLCLERQVWGTKFILIHRTWRESSPISLSPW